MKKQTVVQRCHSSASGLIDTAEKTLVSRQREREKTHREREEREMEGKKRQKKEEEEEEEKKKKGRKIEGKKDGGRRRNL